MTLPSSVFPIGGPIIFTSPTLVPASEDLRDANAVTLRDRQIQIVNTAGDEWKAAFPDQPALGVSWTYDSAAGTLTGSQEGFEGDPPNPSLIVSTLPDNLGRESAAITATVGGVSLPLRDVRGGAVAARQLTPGRLHVMCRTDDAFQIMQSLGVRPRDFQIRMATSADETLTPAEVAAGTASDTDVIATPGWSDRSERRFLFFGVPDDAPPLDSIEQGLGSFNEIGRYDLIDNTVNDPGGVPYRWRRSVSALNWLISQVSWTLRFGAPLPPA